MIYLKIDSNKFVEFDETSSTVSLILKSDLVRQRTTLQSAPPVPANSVLLDWAKINYPGIAEMGRDKDKIAELNAFLVILNAL